MSELSERYYAAHEQRKDLLNEGTPEESDEIQSLEGELESLWWTMTASDKAELKQRFHNDVMQRISGMT